MSQRVVRHARSNAELRGMISRLLSPEQLRVLAACPDLETMLRSLSDTSYRVWLTGLLERGVTVAGAERALASALVDAYRRTALVVGSAGEGLVVAMAGRVETDNLKAVLRAKARGDPPEVVRPLLVPMGDLSKLPTELLLQAEDVEAVVIELAETEYGRVLRAALPRYSAELSLFPVEVALDLDYYRRLWAVVQGLRGLDYHVVGRIMAIRYDVLNVAWVVRYRLIYGLSPEEIFNYVLPHGQRIGDEVVRRAASAEGLDGIAAALPDPYCSFLVAAARASDPLGQVDLVLHRYLVAVARSCLAGYPFHLGVAVAYLWLKEAEVHDLRAITEGKRSGRPVEGIVDHMWGIS